MSDNVIEPRNYRPVGSLIGQDIGKLLQVHPDAFDCLIFKAREGSEETVACNEDVVGSLESGERALGYEVPVKSRAMIIPEEGASFSVMGDGMSENFYGASQPLNLLIAEAARKFSIIQWLEYPSATSDETEERTVYILDSRPVGRTLGAGAIHSCLPLSALGEVPDNDLSPDTDVTAEPNELDLAGVL